MIHQLSERISFLFSERKIIPKDMTEIYSYGFELMISTILNGILVLVVSIILGVFTKTLFLLPPFMLIRSMAGGYHAKTHFGCITGFTITFAISVIALKAMPQSIYFTFTIISLIFSLIVVLVNGSIPNENRKVTPEEKSKFDLISRRRAVCFTIVGMFLAVILPDYGIFFAYGFLLSAVSLIIGKYLARGTSI